MKVSAALEKDTKLQSLTISFEHARSYLVDIIQRGLSAVRWVR